MLNTVPEQREALFEALPEVAAFARPAVRLHPRQGEPSAEQSSAGGPLLWPDAEPWPTCGTDHDQPNVMAPVVQLFKRDIPGDGPLPDWLFPGTSDLLQILWCPNDHLDKGLPVAHLVWREATKLRACCLSEHDVRGLTRWGDSRLTGA